MGRVELFTESAAAELVLEITLSARNALTLLSTLEMPGSARTIFIRDLFINGRHAQFTCLLRIEPDDEHYGKRGVGPGPMHPFSEEFIGRHTDPAARTSEPAPEPPSQAHPSDEVLPRSYPDPAELPAAQRPGVRPHIHPPNRLWPWVFSQHQTWVDVYGNEHEIEWMPHDYIRNVIACCLEHADRICLLVSVDAIAPDTEATVAWDEDAIHALASSIAAAPGEAAEWLETTPLMRALRRRLGQ